MNFEVKKKVHYDAVKFGGRCFLSFACKPPPIIDLLCSSRTDDRAPFSSSFNIYLLQP